MTFKVFFTGVTGYVGGTVLDVLFKRHPELEYTAQLRSPSVAFSERYPEINTIIADYDDFKALEDAAAGADLIIHAGNSDHLAALEALVQGSLRRSTPSYLIHLSGTATIGNGTFPIGDLEPRVWSDIDDITAIQTLPDTAYHRHVDKYLQSIADLHGDSVKIAIMCPPDIYGPGTGTGNKTSYLVPLFVGEVLKRGNSFYLGKGENRKSLVNVLDLAELYILLVEDAIKGGAKVSWGKDAYYFSRSGFFQGRALAVSVGQILYKKGLIKSPDPSAATIEQGLTMLSHMPAGLALYFFGMNAQCTSDRAKLLGWKPTHETFEELLDGEVEGGLDAVSQIKTLPPGPK